MNSIEAMLLRENAAKEYMLRLDKAFAQRYPEALDVGLMIKQNFISAVDGEITMNEALADTLETLDCEDEDDRFGTWGWRHSVLGEDS